VLNSIIGFGLLQCPADLLRVVLSVYMYQEGANIRLPETDEVLMCNSSTTAEDVSSFLNFLLFICLYPSCRWDQTEALCLWDIRPSVPGTYVYECTHAQVEAFCNWFAVTF